MKIWIYDNQFGYFDLLKSNAPLNFDLQHLTASNRITNSDADCLVFFLNDELELMDYIKLQRPYMKTILCSPLESGAILQRDGDFIHIDVNLDKNHLVDSILRLVELNTQYTEQESIKKASY
ncbi:hypothetical protein [Flavobacterium litorale]|uniref:Uncharacterized protein n=1 Tax=Flavobacterium litorale TaxID=2856519 RepID=A0ABX8VBG3_9FLAO|nr:hypothetical protein [Flavobacterium litorale]QYJ68533.1 hypothetical protein K1I41_01225 [Flavobacterium litorale]